MSTPSGWLLLDAGLVALEDGRGGLRLLDGAGEAVATFEGAAADAVRARFADPTSPPAPLLASLARLAPGAGALVGGAAERLTPASVLRRRTWHQLFVELTARCNERCAHCYVAAGPERTEALERDVAEACLREAADLGFAVVQLTGGEALLCPFLADLCLLARGLGIGTVEVFTNGLLLTAERYERLRAARVSFAFSLYGRDPSVHDAVTGVAGSHARTLEAMRRAIGGGSPVRVGVIATRPEDEAQALAAVDLAREAGVPEGAIGLDVARSVGRGHFAGRPAPAVARARDADRDPGAPAPASGPHVGGAASGRPRGGTAAVLADGWVVPCIFSRRLRLGRVGPTGGLRAALSAPAARLASACGDDRDAPAAVAAALRDGRCELTCGECRLTAALLRPREHLEVLG